MQDILCRMGKFIGFLIIMFITVHCNNNFVKMSNDRNETNKTDEIKQRFTKHFYHPISQDDFASLYIVFNYKPTSEEAETTLRAELAKTRLIYKQDILATASFTLTGNDYDEKEIPLLDGSDHLFYDAKLNKIVTSNEREGVKVARYGDDDQNKEYYVEYKEWGMVVAPYTRFGDVNIIFNKQPNKSELDMYKILVDELKKMVPKQKARLRTRIAPYTGNKNNPAGQEQIKKSDGRYFLLEYDPISGEITEWLGKKGCYKKFGTIKQ